MRALAAIACAGLLLAGCRDEEDDEPEQPRPQRESVVFEAAGTPTVDELQQAAVVVGLRLEALGLEATSAGLDAARQRIRIDVVGRGAARAVRDPGITSRARIAFYDWEANVLGPDGRPRPTDRSVTGGERAGDFGAACSPLVDARARAGRVRGDTVVLRAQPTGVHRRADCWFVLRDRPALTGADIAAPEQLSDTQTKEPVVVFGFSERGKRRFSAFTREIADRGAALGANQHFAIARDDQLLTVPFIDHQANPGGIDGESGSQISGGFTVATARALAGQLRSGELRLRLRRVTP